MVTLSKPAFETLISGAQPLSYRPINGQIRPKVWRLNDETIVKLFRVKRLISSARLLPYAKRFCANAYYLRLLGIPTVHVLAVYQIPSMKCTAVHYQSLPGITLREHGAESPLDTDISHRLGYFYHSLHQHGIFFRSIHFGNIVITRDNRFGLIDLVDIRPRKRSLRTGLRIRNLRHLFRYHTDAQMLAPVSNQFIETYCRHAQLSRRNEARFRAHFERYMETFR